ncbi:MAG: ABC transporter substrate-binding protein, partial [Blastochloris sp.]|nr:ABC transporter substrate-binding protein [Blastochloris sp.]
KFGQTSPETSNSGIQTLVLLAYAYHNKTTGLSLADIRDAGFRAWMGDMQQSVANNGYPNSTGNLMEDVMRRGPSQYDFIVVYENLAIENIERVQPWGTLRVYYPPANILSDHPYAILDAPWVAPEQRAAAALSALFC